MPIGPRTAAAALPEVISLIAQPRPATDWLVQLIVARGWCAEPESALELAERWTDSVLETLAGQMSGLAEMGKPQRIAFNSSSPYMLQGAAFVEPGDGEDIRAAKNRRAHLQSYQEHLAHLSPRDFELLCAGLLCLLEADVVALTRAAADDGIDFYGRMRLGRHIFTADPFQSLQRQLVVWVVGQAKRYLASQVSTPDIRDLVGAVALSRVRGLSVQVGGPTTPAIRPCDPVLHMFVTTGAISRDGWHLLRDSGVVGVDGEILAAFLADRQVATREGQFQQDEFGVWLESIRRRLGARA